MVDEVDFKLEDLKHINVPVLFANAGYFTIKESKNNVYTLGYPNKETESVMTKFFIKLLKPNYKIGLVKKVSNELYEGIMSQDKELLEEVFQEMVYRVLGDIAYEWINKNPEGWLKSFLGMFLRLNDMCYYPEVQNLKGRKDLVIPVNNKYYIIEAKVDESARKAIEQINNLYVPQFTDGKEIVKVGVNWEREEKKFEVLIQLHK